MDTIEQLLKENHLLKQQLHNCYLKVAKTQKVSYYKLMKLFFCNKYKSFILA